MGANPYIVQTNGNCFSMLFPNHQTLCHIFLSFQMLIKILVALIQKKAKKNIFSNLKTCNQSIVDHCSLSCLTNHQALSVSFLFFSFWCQGFHLRFFYFGFEGVFLQMGVSASSAPNRFNNKEEATDPLSTRQLPNKKKGEYGHQLQRLFDIWSKIARKH